MDRALRQKVTNTARKIRAWCEAENAKSGPYGTDLTGWCAIASGRLWNELTAKGVQSEIQVAIDSSGCSHVFLLIDDHVVDVTATQFAPLKNEKLVIMHAKEAEVHWFYQPELMFDHPTKLREYQLGANWPANQTVAA